ncbi:MAG: RNA polymerase sigma factor [Dechloromonas sp.]|jgi:RNA polymerase sigma factor (sigma-70 family)|nr:RNA polymerase sigma factor [Dechloromonas sp.]
MEEDGRTDEQLMLAYGDGSVEAFEILYGRWRRPVYRFLVRQCASAGIADELYQDVWLRVVNARRRYTVVARFSTWLFRIAHNRLIDHWRAESRKPVAEMPVADDCETGPLDKVAAPDELQPERLMERKDLAALVAGAVESLPDAQREAFLLHEEGGLTIDEIAALTGVGRETAKSRLRYAMIRLRAQLTEYRR